MKYTIASAALVAVGFFFMQEPGVKEVHSESQVNSLLSSLNEMPSGQNDFEDVNDLLDALDKFPTGK